mgnify:CR=1 FL=1
MHLINVSLQMMDVHVCMLSMVTSVIISRGDPVRHNSIFRNRGVTSTWVKPWIRSNVSQRGRVLGMGGTGPTLWQTRKR